MRIRNSQPIFRPLFQQGKQIAEKSPKTLITDGAPNFHEAYKHEFYTQRVDKSNRAYSGNPPKVVVFTTTRWNGLNGEIRDRERCMRTLEKSDTPILTGMRFFHNYIRPHQALKGKTPAEVAGITVQGENKWMTLIQNASQNQKKNQQP